MTSEKRFKPSEVSSLLFGNQIDNGFMFINAILALKSGSAATTELMAQNIDPEILVWAQATLTATGSQSPESKKLIINQLVDSVKPNKDSQWL